MDPANEPGEIASSDSIQGPPRSDHEMVAELLGRDPMGPYEIALRRTDGSPVILRNGAWLDDGRPMPTRYWLADKALVKAVGKLESTGAITIAENEIPADAIAATHSAAEAERDELVPESHEGPAPSGGVGGTRQGIKCLHAHYANYLMGADDVVGEWVQSRLEIDGSHFNPDTPGLASRIE